MLLKTLHKTAWLTAGIIFLVLAVIGSLLPIIPQMPFFIASIICFVRCSERFNHWLGHQKWFIRFHAWAERHRWFEYVKNHLPLPGHHSDPSGDDP